MAFRNYEKISSCGGVRVSTCYVAPKLCRNGITHNVKILTRNKMALIIIYYYKFYYMIIYNSAYVSMITRNK